MKRQPLLVHLLFHPESASARELARKIHHHLNGDVMVPGLRVPTAFCEAVEGTQPPAEFRFGHAERDAVVVLADDHLTVSHEWCRFVADVAEACEEPGARFLPFQLSEHAWPLDPRLNHRSFAPAHRQLEARDWLPWIGRRLVVELCRYLSDLGSVEKGEFKVPVTLFLSHAKGDLEREPKVTASLIECLKGDQPLEAWVDSGEIATGSKFAEAIAQGVGRSSLLAVLTDRYATREWCREEVLLAKEKGRPVVVVDALSSHETRSFPYLGNVPRIRWDGDPQKGVDLLLKETLRHLHDTALLQLYETEGDLLFARPPELATLVGLEPGVTVLYPDPPVGIGERRRLEKAGVPFETPLQRLSSSQSLAGRKIALSMSESTDIESCGMDPAHLETCMVELSRFLLIEGATLVYGGFLGSESYTEKLFEVVRANNSLEGVEPYERILNLRGWPLPRLPVGKRAELKHNTVEEMPRPTDVDESLHPDLVENPEFFPAEKSPAHRFAWARGMTEMRAYQADVARSGVAARIVLGGTFGPTWKLGEDGSRSEKWYASRIPGVLEEIVLSIQAGQPVFLIGAFGGAAEMVIDLLRGEDREEASWGYQKRAPHAPEMRALYEERGIEWLDYPEIVSLVRDRGREGINPLLSAEEQDELFDAVDPVRITELVLTGLGRL